MSPRPWLLCLVLAACAGAPRAPVEPVQLVLPPADAPFEERLAAYKRLAPKDIGVIVVTSSNGGSSETAYLTLQDGRVIYNPAVLLAVVAEDSPTARLTARHEEQMSQRRKLRRSGLAMLLGSALLVGAAGATESEALFQAEALGVALLVPGAAVTFSTSLLLGKHQARTAKKALFTYDFSLRQALDICYDDLKEVVYDCKEPPSYLPTP
jgi:hypothetical protein